MTQLKQEEQQQQPRIISNNSGSRRRIFLVTEGHRSKQTAYKYGANFNCFLDFIRIHDLDVFLDLGKEAIQELVIKYVLSMRDNPQKRPWYTRGTVNTRVAAILYFLDNNDIELNKRKIKRYYPSDESTNDDRPYTIEEIAKILAVCDLRSKAMILLMASAGLRIGSLSSIQIGDLTETNYDNLRLFKVQVYAHTRSRYFSFCTPECYNAIQEYLNFRKRYGEEIKDKSPLFRKHFNKLDHFTVKNLPNFLKDSTVMRTVDEVLKRSGVKNKEAMRSHAFRKGFMSICERSGMKSINVKMLLGHDIGVSGHYYRPAESDLLEDFMSHASDALTIDPNQRLKARVKELEGNQAQQIAGLTARIQQQDELLDEYHKYREDSKHLLDSMKSALEENGLW